jgi:hypothetical protein
VNTAKKTATMVSSKENTKETRAYDDNVMNEGKETVSPTASATNGNNTGPEMKEFSILFKLPVRHGHSIDDRLRLHPQLLNVLTTTFDNSKLSILNNKNKRITNFAALKWSNKH